LKSLRDLSKPLGFTLVAVALISMACIAKAPRQRGILTGDWTKSGSSESEVVKLSYASDQSIGGTINVTLGAGGEHFRGEFVRLSDDSQGTEVAGRVMSAWGAKWEGQSKSDQEDSWLPGSKKDGGFGTEAGSGFNFYLRKHYSGRVIAWLEGNRGHNMRCRMELKLPAEGMSGGGSGECQASEGSQVIIRF